MLGDGAVDIPTEEMLKRRPRAIGILFEGISQSVGEKLTQHQPQVGRERCPPVELAQNGKIIGSQALGDVDEGGVELGQEVGQVSLHAV